MSFIPMAGEGLEELTTLFRLLGDKTRLNIVLLLAGGERNVTDLCSALALPQPTVSHHLGLLRMHSVIGNRRNGKQIFYALSGPIGIDTQRGMTIDMGAIQVMISNSASPSISADA